MHAPAPTADFTARLAALRAEPSTDAPTDVARLARVERTRTEMMTQGEAIAATLQSARADTAAIVARLGGRRFTHVTIAGCGDSWFVGMAAKHLFETLLAIPCIAVQAFDYAHYDHVSAGPGTLAIGLSSGGNTPAVMTALAQARARGAFAVGVSNTVASPILTRFDAGLQVLAERRGWPTQSSTAAIALLGQLALALGRSQSADAAGEARLASELDALPVLASNTAAAHDGPMRSVATSFVEASSVLFTGAGPWFAAASFGAAKVRELAPIHAFALPLEEMHHYRLPKQGDCVVIVAPDAASRERALDTVLVGEAVGATMFALLGAADADIGTRAKHVAVVQEATGLLGVVAASVPLHLLAYHLATLRAAGAQALTARVGGG